MAKSDSSKVKIIFSGKPLSKDFFYLYHNWAAGQENKIHLESCAHCNYGFGQRRIQIRGRNGVWIGPFDTPELAEEYCLGNGIVHHDRHDCV